MIPRRLSHSGRLDYSAGAGSGGPHQKGEAISIMTQLSFLRRHCPAMPAFLATAAVAGALLCGSAVGEDAANPNVIVDDSALDGPASNSGNSTELLPAPAHQPVSHLVTSGQSAIEVTTTPETTTETTFSAVPTSAIQSTDLQTSP